LLAGATLHSAKKYRKKKQMILYKSPYKMNKFCDFTARGSFSIFLVALGGWLAGWKLSGWRLAGWRLTGWLEASWASGWLAGGWLAGELAGWLEAGWKLAGVILL
jgi:hypothetical protein